jgi:hypothetical protein
LKGLCALVPLFGALLCETSLHAVVILEEDVSYASQVENVVLFPYCYTGVALSASAATAAAAAVPLPVP